MEITIKTKIPMYNPKTMATEMVEAEQTFYGSYNEIQEQIIQYYIAVGLQCQQIKELWENNR